MHNHHARLVTTATLEPGTLVDTPVGLLPADRLERVKDSFLLDLGTEPDGDKVFLYIFI